MVSREAFHFERRLVEFHDAGVFREVDAAEQPVGKQGLREPTSRSPVR